ncbi:hypothetical protein CONLIGDRAFT_293353 [Coniochaeta ligniaria NRRL 30616]|uniref:Uncharacterized protein n=1 Tax=Coniochaeta ligniaria NRRL 30616 TaxID=1408157 RepID=A0A1J7ITQ5_9PEZI|nr:hypothetical protein CONLIGDRAFT_293353 [Coniochaeta ligniaria NRRL 30616]
MKTSEAQGQQVLLVMESLRVSRLVYRRTQPPYVRCDRELPTPRTSAPLHAGGARILLSARQITGNHMYWRGLNGPEATLELIRQESFGVAKEAKIADVKVVKGGGAGGASSCQSGLQWVLDCMDANIEQRPSLASILNERSSTSFACLGPFGTILPGAPVSSVRTRYRQGIRTLG